MALIAEERETIIVMNDGEEKIMINSSQRKMVTLLRKNPAFEETDYDKENNILTGFLPIGAITVRTKVGARRAKVLSNGEKRTLPNVARCGAPKTDGTACQAIASKATGRCSKHPVEGVKDADSNMA